MALSEIKEALKALGLVQSRCPTIKELRSKLRKLQKQFHPDKNEDKDDTNFKKVMEDGEKVLLFIRDHPEMQEKGEEIQDIHLLKFLRAGEELQVNKESYTIFLGSSWGNLEELVQATEGALKSKRKGEGGANGTRIQGEMDSQGVTITFWQEPKSDRKSKMLIQGKAHESFLLFLLPEILKEASDKMGTNPLAIQLEDRTGGQEEVGGELDIVTALAGLKNGFHQLELTVRDVDTRMAKVEERMAKVEDKLDTRMAKVEERMAKVEEKLDKVVVSLPKSMSIGVTENNLKEMSGSLKDLGKILEEVKTGQTEARMGNNSEVLVEISSGIKELVKAVGGQGPRDRISSASLAVGTNKSKIVEAEEEPRKRALILASSVGKGLELKNISQRLHVKVDLLEVAGIEVEEEGKVGLAETVTNVENVDIVVIQCGSSDVTKAQTGEKANVVRGAGEKLVSMAEELAEKENCEVFISQLPPRYDDGESGKGDLAKLTEVFNNQVKASAMFLAKVHIVPQGRLASSGKQLEARYQSDGLHLTEVGAGLLTKSIIEAIAKVKTELVIEATEKAPSSPSQAVQPGKQESATSHGRGGRGGRRFEERGGRGFEERGGRGRGRGQEETRWQAPPPSGNRWRGGQGSDFERPWDNRSQANWGYGERGPYYGPN